MGIDRAINDGRAFALTRGDDRDDPADGAWYVVCGASIPLPAKPDAVGGERTDDLRVTLTSGD